MLLRFVFRGSSGGLAARAVRLCQGGTEQGRSPETAVRGARHGAVPAAFADGRSPGGSRALPSSAGVGRRLGAGRRCGKAPRGGPPVPALAARRPPAARSRGAARGSAAWPPAGRGCRPPAADVPRAPLRPPGPRPLAQPLPVARWSGPRSGAEQRLRAAPPRPAPARSAARPPPAGALPPLGPSLLSSLPSTALPARWPGPRFPSLPSSLVMCRLFCLRWKQFLALRLAPGGPLPGGAGWGAVRPSPCRRRSAPRRDPRGALGARAEAGRTMPASVR